MKSIATVPAMSFFPALLMFFILVSENIMEAFLAIGPIALSARCSITLSDNRRLSILKFVAYAAVRTDAGLFYCPLRVARSPSPFASVRHS